MAKVTMPQLGESVAEGTIGRWLKQPGDTVAKYEPLLEVITDKVNAEVPSPFAGVLKEILAEEGATVPNNAEIAIIETEDEALAGGTERCRRARRAPRSGPARLPTAPSPSSPPTATPRGAPPTAPPAPTSARRAARHAQRRPPPRPRAAPSAARAPRRTRDPNARMTPAVRRLLREHGLEASQIAGTGGGGRITREDVLALRRGRPDRARRPRPRPPRPPPPPPPRPAGPGRRARAAAATNAGITFPAGADEVLVPMTQMRKGIAAQMTRALSAPHAYVQMEVDATRLVRLRESVKKAYQAKEGIGLSLRPVRRQGVGRGAQAEPDLQRPLDRPGPAREAPDQHRRGGRGRRGADRPGHPRRGHALDPRPQRSRSRTSRTGPG